MFASLNFSNKNRGVGIFILRLFAGARLIYGVLDNVMNWSRMIEFRDFLETYHFPIPLISAIVSVYTQLLAGICYLLGWHIRYAAIFMIINFLVALFMVHRGQSFEQMTPPLSMLFISVLFLFEGAGKYSLDAKMAANK